MKWIVQVHQRPARVKVRVDHANDLGSTQFYATEMLPAGLFITSRSEPAAIPARQNGFVQLRH